MFYFLNGHKGQQWAHSTLKISLYKGHEVRFRSEARGGDTSLLDTPLKLH